jgi:hypothetical protein
MAAGVNLDIEDIFAGVFGAIIARAILFLLAVWSSCSIGAGALMIGKGSLQVRRLGDFAGHVGNRRLADPPIAGECLGARPWNAACGKRRMIWRNQRS